MGMRDPALAVRRMDMAGRALGLVGHWADEICGLRGRLVRELQDFRVEFTVAGQMTKLACSLPVSSDSL